MRRDILRRSSVGAAGHEPVRAPADAAATSLWRGRHVRVLREPVVNTYWARHGHRRASRSDDTSYRGSSTTRRSLRPAARTAQDRRQVQSGSRLPPAGRHASATSRARFSPRPREPARSASSSTGVDRAHREQRRTARIARARGEFALEFQNADRFTATYTGIVRVPAGALPDRERRHPAGRRLRFRQLPGRLQPARSSASPGNLRPNTARSTTATRRRSGSPRPHAITNQFSVEPTYSMN